MKNIYLKLSLTGLALFSSLNSYAIPTPTSGLSISVAGLYLQPNADNMTYAVYTTPLPVTTPNWKQLTVEPSHHGAFDLGLMYNFVDPSNHVNFDWMHLGSSDSESFTTTAANTSVAPPYYFGPLAQALNGTFASGKAKFNIDDANLILGHLMNLTGNVQVDPYVGVEGSYLKQEIISRYTGTDSNNVAYSITQDSTSKFIGMGPRFGVNATYFVNDSFGITAKMGAALLLGSMQSTTNFNSFGAGNTTLAKTSLADQSLNKIVPEANTALEASYRVKLKSPGSSITLAIGYLFTEYFNGINQVEPTALVPGAFNGGTIAIETSQQMMSSLSLNGPYVNVVWKI